MVPDLSLSATWSIVPSGRERGMGQMPYSAFGDR
jgi:hypothetical protein